MHAATTLTPHGRGTAGTHACMDPSLTLRPSSCDQRSAFASIDGHQNLNLNLGVPLSRVCMVAHFHENKALAPQEVGETLPTKRVPAPVCGGNATHACRVYCDFHHAHGALLMATIATATAVSPPTRHSTRAAERTARPIHMPAAAAGYWMEDGKVWRWKQLSIHDSMQGINKVGWWGRLGPPARGPKACTWTS